VIVNLDTLEYIDPVKFGQEPTLAGMVSLRAAPPWPKAFEKADPRGVSIVDVAGGLFVMLCHPQRRGGGDIPANAAEMGGIDKERARAAKLFKGVETSKDAGAAAIFSALAKSATRIGRRPRKYSREGPTSATRSSAIS
jgi:hypothetical protein